MSNLLNAIRNAEFSLLSNGQESERGSVVRQLVIGKSEFLFAKLNDEAEHDYALLINGVSVDFDLLENSVMFEINGEVLEWDITPNNTLYHSVFNDEADCYVLESL